jgi:hypothetical protein
MEVGGQRHDPAVLHPPKTRYPLYTRLCGPQGRSGLVQKNSPPLGIDPRTVQPVASRYTDYAIPAHVRTVCNTSPLDTDLEHDGTKRHVYYTYLFEREMCHCLSLVTA